jgi:hypothetical protein
MKTKLIATLLLAGSSLFAGPRFGIGVGIGVPVAPPIVSYATPCPGPGYSWIGGSWVFVGGPHYYAPAYRRGPVFAGHYYGGRSFRRR